MLGKQNYSRRRILALGLVAVVIVFILWNVREVSFLLYPFRLFVTYVHEAGHGSAAILTGGELRSFEIFANGAGVAYTAGGTRALVIPAGYLGAALFGAVLFYLTNRFGHSRTIAVILGVLLLGFSLLFGRSSATAFIVGIAFGAVVIVCGWKLNREINIILLNVLAMMTGLNAVLDVYYLVGNSGAGLGSTPNDALAFQNEIAPLIPAAVWALVWVLIALALLGAAIWFAIIHPLRR